MKIHYHEDTDTSPIDWMDEHLFIVANHRQFYVPAPKEKRVHGNEVEVYKDTHWIVPVEAYIHSGVTLAVLDNGNFPDRQWDVSYVGHVFLRKSDWPNPTDAFETAKSYINEWNTYLSGDVWGYSIEDDAGNQLDSCWGFFGLKEATAAAKSSLEHLKSVAA